MTFDKFLIKITEKWPAKVLSLAAALIISIFYRLNTLESRIITVPLKTEGASGLIPVDSLNPTVRLTLRGESGIINNFSDDDIEAFINLNRYDKEGTYRIPIQIRKTGNALNIEPLEISVSPPEIYITLEEKASRYIHVYPVFTGNVASGFNITTHSITPESIIVSGPRSSLDALQELNTDIIDLEGRNSSFTILVPINNDDPNITIHGNKLIEYNCIISPIERTSFVIINEPLVFDGETEE